MLWSSLNVVVMTILFMYMVNKAKCAETRKLALVPLATAAVELLAAGLLRPGLYPALTALLIAMRLVIIGCCVAALRRDAAMAKSRARRRAPGPAGSGGSTAAAGGSQAPPMRMTRG